MRIETLAVHAGIRVDPTTGAVVPPLHTATTFEHEPDSTYPRGYLYSRSANPNRNALEECLSELEGGAGAVAFASASAATAAVFQALAPGDHVVAPLDAYFGTGKLLRDTFVPWGLVVDFVDMTDTAAIKAALTPRTKIVWVGDAVEPAVAGHRRGGGRGARPRRRRRSACATTRRPRCSSGRWRCGADLVVYATTKYLGGHGDVLGGAVVARTRDALFERVRAIQGSGGAVPSPFDCWLVRRGIRTLPWRMRAHSDNALKVATFLATHPARRGRALPRPRLPSPARVARRQMTGFGGMLSVQVRGGRTAAFAVERKVRIFTCATSFGGTESLLEHRASVEGAATRSPDNLLRLSIGLEHADDLIEDLGQALG